MKILYDAMSDEDSEVRALAARRWGPLRNKAAKSVLTRGLKDENPYVRIASAESLFQLGDAAGVEVLREMVQDVPAPPKEGTEVGILLQMRIIAKNKVRVGALRALGRMGNAASEKFLKEALADPDGSVRDAAAAILGGRGDREALGGFIQALGQDDAAIRERAVFAMSDAAGDWTIDYLKPFADDPSENVRAAVMIVLGRTRSPRAIPLLAKALEDKNGLVVGKAVEALSLIPSRDAVPLLQKALKNAGNAVIELHAAAGLARFGEKTGLGTAEKALDQQDDLDARLLAVDVFEAHGGERALERLRFALADRSAPVRVRAAAALVNLLQEKDDTTNKR